MPTLRSSTSGLGIQAPVPPTKTTGKVKTGKVAKGKVAKTTKVNNLLSIVPNTTVDNDTSTVLLPTPHYLSGFGSLLDDSNPLTGYEAQAARLCELINPPKLPNRYSGDKKDWPYFTAMLENYVRTRLRNRNIDLMSTEGYDDEIESRIYEWFMSLMNSETFDLIDPIHKNKGTKAYQFMDEQLRGTIEQRKFDCNDRIIKIRYLWGESPDKYVAELTRLVQESKALGLHTPLGLILGLQIKNFPKELHYLQNKLQEKYQDNGYPTSIGDYTLNFRREMNRLKMNGTFPKTTVNIAAAAEENNPTSSNN